MNEFASCPDSAYFQKLYRGELSSGDIEELGRHVDQCAVCTQTMANFDGGTSAPEMNRNKKLISKSKTVPGFLHTAFNPESGKIDWGEEDRASHSAEVDLAFLSPSQGPDEIGRLGGYRVLRLLGQGGMGLVFEAEDVRLKRRVALKVMKPEIASMEEPRRRFMREAQAAAHVEHDHIVPIHQIGEENGVPFIAMPFLKGEPLDARLKRGRLDVSEIRAIGQQTAEGLAAAHEKGLIHRDIKPGNIWLEEIAGATFRVKILDFGLARLAEEEVNLTKSGEVLGTPAYMAPEQARSQPVDHRTDLFSLGCVLYEASTGVRPFVGENTMTILTSLALDTPTEPLARNPSLPPALSHLIMKLLEKEPWRRPQSAEEVARILKRLTVTEVVYRSDIAPPSIVEPTEVSRPIPATKMAEPTQKSSKRRRLIGALFFAILLAAAGAFYFDTNESAVRIETDDPNIEVVFDRNGPTIKGADKNPVSLKPGEHVLVVKRGDLEFETDKFILKKGEIIALKVELIKGKIRVVRGDVVIGQKELPLAKKEKPKEVATAKKEDAAMWEKRVAALPTEIRVEEVVKRLKELNPGFEGSATHSIEDGEVASLGFSSDHVTDISPVRALTGLQKLNCSGSDERNGQLAELSPLKDLKLGILNCNNTQVSDLSPLKSMNLTELYCIGTKVSNLTPLKEMKLTSLYCGMTQVSDLSPLKDMKLTSLGCDNTNVSDLTPLKDMKLTFLLFENTNVSNLSPLKEMKLLSLNGDYTQISDLSPLKNMKLTQFSCGGTKVSNLTPLKDMKLTSLHCWKTPVSDLSPLKDMPLTNLRCNDTKVSDLSPLKDAPLTNLSCNDTEVSDLTPLKDTKLKILDCRRTKVTDLSPLLGLRLEELSCDFKAERDTEILKAIRTLETINDKPAAKFWKEVDAKQAAK